MQARSRLLAAGFIFALFLAVAGVLFFAGASPVANAQGSTGTPGTATTAPTTAATATVAATSTVAATTAATTTVAATVSSTAAATTTVTATSTVSVTLPTIPPPLAVQVDPKTTALLILDVTNVICTPARPTCLATVPADAALLKKARDAGALVVYSDTGGNSTILPDVAPGANDPKVSGRADKFFNTTLDDTLKGKGIKTVVIVGYVANGAVLYTTFGANVRGYTAVVPVDGTGAEDPFAKLMTFYQLLNEPGFANPTNQALIESRVVLSRSDLITFVPGATPPQTVAPPGTPQSTPQATTASTAAPTAGTPQATTASTAAPTAGTPQATPAGTSTSASSGPTSTATPTATP